MNKIICKMFTKDYKEIIMKQVFLMTSVFNQIMLNIQKGYYRYIGSGSCRDVFDLSNGYVIKIAKNKAGIAQNKNEYKISCCDKSDLFAKVIQVSEDFSYLIMEKAKQVNNILDICNYFKVSNKNELRNLEKMQNIRRSYDLLLGDFERKNNWGLIKGKPVIIDYGFTNEVRLKYYHSK
jgi:hypothetical protein